jgi:hypothetical protein
MIVRKSIHSFLYRKMAPEHKEAARENARNAKVPRWRRRFKHLLSLRRDLSAGLAALYSSLKIIYR